MVDQAPKWVCPLCTYANWPKSPRCTVCQASRDLPSIEDEMLRLDIGGNLSSKLVRGGWACPSCTFENWAASMKCTQCGTASPGGPCTIPQTVSHTSESSPTSISPMAQLGTIKWTCPVCTYVNWPKSKRCIMCQSVPITSNVVEEPPAISQEDCFLSVCKAIVLGHDEELQKRLLLARQEAFASRRITADECSYLKQWFSVRASSDQAPPFRSGATLVDLAQACHRHDLASLFLALRPQIPSIISDTAAATVANSVCDGVTGRRKQPPCQASPCVAKELRLYLDRCVRRREGEFCCSYLTEFGMFALPSEVHKFPAGVQEVLLSDICDKDAQTELETRSQAINWWVLEGQYNQSTSRLFALWNRTDGDCLLDSLMQSCWGIFDTQRTLRQALSESLVNCEPHFFRVWRDYERQQTANHYHLDDHQLQRDWRSALEAASLPRQPLEQIHIFVLAHILRRPVIVYSVKYIRNYRDEPIGLANFQGVYLPVLWERRFCSRDPVVLGYTRGHFSALIPMEPEGSSLAAAPQPPLEEGEELRKCLSEDGSASTGPSEPLVRTSSDPGNLSQSLGEKAVQSPHAQALTNERSIYLPLFDRHGQPLPTPFASRRETSSSTQLLRDRLDTVSTRLGLLLARLRLPSRRHHLMETIVHDWLTQYRSMVPATEEADPFSTAAKGPRSRALSPHAATRPPAPGLSSSSSSPLPQLDGH